MTNFEKDQLRMKIIKAKHRKAEERYHKALETNDPAERCVMLFKLSAVKSQMERMKRKMHLYSEADRSVGIPASIQYECDRCGRICGLSEWWFDALYDTPDGELCADCIMKIAYPAPVHTPDDAEEFLCCETCGEPDDGTGNLYKDEEGICCAQCALKRIAYPKITK